MIVSANVCAGCGEEILRAQERSRDQNDEYWHSGCIPLEGDGVNAGAWDGLGESEPAALDSTTSRQCLRAVRLDPERARGRTTCGSFFCDFGRHVLRGLGTNLSSCTPSLDERAVLARRGVSATVVVSYLAWRRSSLVVAIVPLVADVLFQLYGQAFDALQFSSLKQQQPCLFAGFSPVMKALRILKFIEIGALIFAIVLAITAVKKWDNFRASRRLVMYGWLLYFLSSFVISFFPYRVTAGVPDLTPDCAAQLANASGTHNTTAASSLITNLAAQQAQGTISEGTWQSAVGAYVGLYFFLELAPAAMTLPIVVIRTAMNIRTLLPQNPLPGYIAMATPIVSGPLIWLAFVILVQSVGNPFLFAGLLIWTLGPFMFVLFARSTLRPMDLHRAHVYASRLRWSYVATILLAVICFLLFLSTLRVGDWLLKSLVTPQKLIEFVVAFLAEYFFSNVFAGDVMVMGIAKTRRWQLDVQRDAELTMSDSSARKPGGNDGIETVADIQLLDQRRDAIAEKRNNAQKLLHEAQSRENQLATLVRKV